MPPKEKYTDPKLRDEVKEEIQESDKGGAPGQWSARKAQMMAKEYKKRGGDYNTDKKDKDESQKNLSKWGEEDWQTKEGSGKAKKEDGTEARYLPKKAWDKMTEEEKQATEKEKEKGSKQGKQHVANTDKAKQSRKEAGKETSDAEENSDEKESKSKSATKKQDKENKSSRSKDNSTRQTRSSTKRSNDDIKNDKDDEPPKKTSKKTDHGVDGKSTYGSKHQSTEAPAAQGSNTRLPKKGQKVTWKAMPGWVDGEVIEVLKEDKTVEGGKKVKASKDAPRIVLRSHGPSGKVAVHKPDAVFFD